MIPLSTVRQSIQQAQSASRRLRELIWQDDCPDVLDVQAAMEAGAHPLWMTKQGTQASEHALVVAVRKGWLQVAKVMIDYAGPLPAPRGKSMFTIALGEHGKPPPVQDFKDMVTMLVAAGYALPELPGGVDQSLIHAFQSNSPDHAAILMAHGALGDGTSSSLITKVLNTAMTCPGGVEALIAGSSQEVQDGFKPHWWTCAHHASPFALDAVVSLGLELGTPSIDDLWAASRESPSLRAKLAQSGLPIELMGRVDEWDEESALQPYWCCVPNAVFAMLTLGSSVPGLDLSSVDPASGDNWLMHQIKKGGVVCPYGFVSAGSSDYMLRALPAAIAAGLDLSARDALGYTAGWHIINELREAQESQERSTSRKESASGWIELMTQFDLWSPRVMVNGVEQSILEAHGGRISGYLRGVNLLDRALASVEQARLNEATQPSSDNRATFRRI